MRKILSIILSITMLFTMSTAVFAEENQNYEYILPMEYARIDRFDNCYIAYDKQEKCAIYSLDGTKLTGDYDSIGPFNEQGVALAMNDNVNYTINFQGDILGKFDKRIMGGLGDYIIMNLSDENEDGRPSSYFMGEFGVYTYNGELLKVLSYNKFNPSKNSGFGIIFAGNRLLFKENGKWGAIDENFSEVIEPIYSTLYPFEAENGITIAEKDGGKYGLIDKDGNVVVDFIYDAIEPVYKQGGTINAYRVMQGDEYMAMHGEKYGMLDKQGNIIKKLDELVPQTLYEEYELISVFKDNTREDKEQYGSLFGLIDYNGNVIIPIEHTDITHISEGIISVQKSYDHRGYYDLKGNEITNFKYRMASPFSDGLAFVSYCVNDVWTHEVINNKGETVFNPSGWAGGFYGGLAHVADGVLIDTTGKIVIDNPEWKTVSGIDWWSYKDDGTFIVSNGESYGVVKYKGFISDWAKDSVSKAKEKHILESDKKYNYTQAITREEFCELVFNLICAVNRGFHTDDREVKFADTDNHKVLALNRADIIYGKSETEFAPNDFLTREEAATILVRMINREMPMAATEMWFEFDDINDISDWASDSVQTMCNLGFMIGVGENKFAPKDTYTVEQAIVTLMRIYEATRKTYTYETPLGVIQTEENYNSYINFAIQCDAKVVLIQDRTNYDETHDVIEKPVKALTDQTSSMLISFDDFAEIFDGEWKLNKGVFEFTYDTSYEVKLSKFEKYESGEWPNKSEAVNVITFYPDMSIIRVNGNDMEIKAQNGGRVYNSAITMYEGELYIPVQMVAELLKFDIATLQAIY